VPSAPITRWPGTMITIGLRPLASPTARAVADGRAERHPTQRRPHALLERGARGGERHRERGQTVGEVSVKLVARDGEDGAAVATHRARRGCDRPHVHPGQSGVGRGQERIADRSGSAA
jgi:hypothetical protein